MTLLKKQLLATAVIASSFAPAALATTPYDSIIIEGNTSFLEWNIQGDYNANVVPLFRVEIQFDGTLPPTTSTSNEISYLDNIKFIGLRAQNADNTRYVFGDFDTSSMDSETTYTDGATQTIVWTLSDNNGHDYELSLTSIDALIFEAINGNAFPVNSTSATGEFDFVFGFETFFMSGISETITVNLTDHDEDGIIAGDACPMSNLATMVSLNGTTTPIQNRLGENGCTIMDVFAACEAEQSEQQTGFFQPAYRGSSYCETQAVYSLYRDGVINYNEVRILRSAL
ncbi:hypothetical protein [Pseudidiomarina sediminum]|uniref:hypothetical protein n=1 Tax=Pseudidiomarina sediminum TaxID=431675 RepID=UPI001C977DE7|nr:hypothetical protein [Pseudidiomarina sediminum]MBY6063665.1 hypothetical protein [Pseudidiomarina sediminum]